MISRFPALFLNYAEQTFGLYRSRQNRSARLPYCTVVVLVELPVSSNFRHLQEW